MSGAGVAQEVKRPITRVNPADADGAQQIEKLLLDMQKQRFIKVQDAER